MNEPVAIAVLAKAPLPGFAKTRLIPALGADGAASLQARLVERAVATACAALVGPVTLWATPDESDPLFRAMDAHFGVGLARQGGCDCGGECARAGDRHRLPGTHVRPPAHGGGHSARRRRRGDHSD